MVLIRDAVLSDAPRLAEIYRYYVQKTAITFEYDPPAVSAFQSRMERTMERYPYLVAEVDGTVQGYAYAGAFKDRAAYDWSCELSIYLNPHARRNGLGRALYEAMEDRLSKMGMLNLYACIGVPEAEDEYLTMDSVRFHRAMGFATVGTFRNCGYKFGRWYHMVWMEKVIGSHQIPTAPVRWYRQNNKSK